MPALLTKNNGNTFAEPTRATIEFFKEQDSWHPSFVNSTIMGIPSRFAGLPGDIISIDEYLTNREGRKVRKIIDQVEGMVAAAAPTHRPVWMFLVGNNLYNHTREPTLPNRSPKLMEPQLPVLPVYLLSVNLDTQPVTADFSFPGIQSVGGVVLFEDRRAAILDGKMQEDFAPHQRHVYRFTLP